MPSTIKDMIEIISHPGPDRSVTIEGLKHYKVKNRRYRNRRIGEFLKELHLTEGRNTGFKKILDAIKANGSPLPEFETDEDHSYFISRLFIHEGFLQDTEPHSCKEGSETTPELPPNYPRTTRDKILEIIQKNPRISRKEIADQLGLSIDGVRYHIRKLTEDKILEYIGNSRNGYWKISLDSINKT